jgi:hypothetical protein
MGVLDASHQMRTTLTLDDDVLAAARVLARQRRQPIGSVISALARQALATPTQPATSPVQTHRNGVPLLPLQPGGAPVDLELVNQLRDETP